VLGGFAVRRGQWQADDAAWDRRIARRVVYYLLVRRSVAVPSDVLIETFWPGTPPDSARRSLKVAVSCARAVLDVTGAPTVIEASGGTLALRLGGRGSVDCDGFEAAARMALAADGEERITLLRRADSLWTGEPLPEERYEEWSAAWREALVGRYSEVLTALALAHENRGDHHAASQAGRKLVELDPLDEAAHRQLIQSYARAGRRAHALRQFLACRRTLVDELGIEPASETRDLQQRILAGEPV
jgi:DNA-binding SARP family transcriptional activator